MKKIVMNLDDYKGNYAMHCPTKESAKLFCNFLDENGREWGNGRSYKEYTFWGVYKSETIYYFNEGMFNGAERDEEEELTILEIDDFIVDDEEKLTIAEAEKRIIEKAKEIFEIYQKSLGGSEVYFGIRLGCSPYIGNKEYIIVNNNFEQFCSMRNCEFGGSPTIKISESIKMEDLK